MAEFLSGFEEASIIIRPSGKDYGLTYTFYYVKSGGLIRRVAASELTIPGVELSGVSVLGRKEAAIFLEEAARLCNNSNSVAHFLSATGIDKWLDVPCGRRQSNMPSKGEAVFCGALEDDEDMFLAHLRMDSSLRLATETNVWVGYLGMDWPEYFFEYNGRICSHEAEFS
jgi:hypothetical protein